jgi:tetratricopeptide (TPR) repeat protein
MSKRKLKRQKKKGIKEKVLASKRRSLIDDTLSNLEMLVQTGQQAEAEKVFDEIVDLKPDSLETVNVLSNIAVRLKKLDTSIELLQKGCRINPKDVDTRYDLGIRLVHAKRFEEAVETFKKAASLAPEDAEIHYDLGNAYYELGEYKDAAKAFNKAISLRPRYLEAYNNLGRVYEDQQDIPKAIESYQQVLSLNPEHEGAGIKLKKIFSDAVPAWHFPMLNDQSRNDAYEKAIKKAVKGNHTVLDIGTGSGLLSMMAARCGAKAVCTCETNPLIAEKAKQIIDNNGFGNIITVINKNSLGLTAGDDFPNKFDVVIAEIFDAGLLGEGVFTVLQHAREELLIPGGQLLPCKAKVFATLVDSEELWQEGNTGRVNGFDLDSFNEFSPWPYLQRKLNNFQYNILSEIAEVFTFDFASTLAGSESKQLKFTITDNGVCHAVSFWFRLYLDDEIYIETSPQKSSHWNQSVQLMKTPYGVKQGQEVVMAANHNSHFISFLDQEADA